MCQHITAVRGGSSLFRRVGNDHPANHQVEEEHWVDCQGSPGSRVTISQEHHGGEG